MQKSKIKIITIRKFKKENARESYKFVVAKQKLKICDSIDEPKIQTNQF